VVALPGAIRVDGWVAHPHLNAFICGDETVRVEPKVMELFVRLAESPGRVVSKAELLDSVWAGVVVGEDSLTRAMSELRRALGDDARKPRIIETIPKRGYRLIAPVSLLPPGEPAITQASTAAARPVESTDPTALVPPLESVWLSRRGWASVALLTLVFGTLVVAARPWLSPTPVAPALVLVGPFENDTGDAELTDAVTNLVGQVIARSERVAVVPAIRVSDVLTRMRQPEHAIADLATAREVMARDSAIAALAAGRIARIGGDIAVRVELTDANGGLVTSVAARAADLETLRAALMSETPFDGLVMPARSRRVLPPVTTSSLLALQLFSQALEALERPAGPHGTAIPALEQALELDPGFAMAKAWLHKAMIGASRGRISRELVEYPPETIPQLASESLALLPLVTEPEQLLIKGMVLPHVARHDEAVVALEALARLEPDFFEFDRRVALLRLYDRKGDFDAYGEEALGIARLKPDDFASIVTAAAYLVTTPDGLERARPFLVRARELMTPDVLERPASAGDVAWLRHFDAFERWRAGDLAGTVEVLDGIRTGIPRESEALRQSMTSTNGSFWLMLGRLKDARQVFEMGVDERQWRLDVAHIPRIGDDWDGVLAELGPDRVNSLVLARAGRFAEARARLAGALPMVQERDGPTVDLLAAAASGRLEGQPLALQTEVDRWRPLGTSAFYLKSLELAEVWDKVGNVSQAIRVLEETVAQPPTFMGPPDPAGHWWLKAHVELVGAYRRVGRLAEADPLEAEVRRLMAVADPDHPFFRALAASSQVALAPGRQPAR